MCLGATEWCLLPTSPDGERDRGHLPCYLAVLLPEGGREELDWEMGLYQPWGWGVLQLLNTCGTGDLEV